MPSLPAEEVYALREKNGYGVIKLVDCIVQMQVVWASAWPPPEDMLLVVPQNRPPTIIEMPEEPEQLHIMRDGIRDYGWMIFRVERGSFSTIGDDKAKEMPKVVRFAEYHQREAFQP